MTIPDEKENSQPTKDLQLEINAGKKEVTDEDVNTTNEDCHMGVPVDHGYAWLITMSEYRLIYTYIYFCIYVGFKNFSQ